MLGTRGNGYITSSSWGYIFSQSRQYAGTVIAIYLLFYFAVYSFGMIMVELLTLHPPYDEVQNMLHLANKIVSGELPAITHPNLVSY